MNSLDPWRVIATDPYGSVVLPPPYYGHPFYRQVPGWIDHFGGTAGVTRQLFDGAFVGSDPVVSGFFDSVKKAVLKYTGTTATNKFIKKNKLEPYVKLAATAVATAYGGPAAGAAAGALADPVMNLGIKPEAQRQVQQISTAVQQRSPELSPAVAVAQDAIQKTATAYHVAQIVNDAKAGNPEAQRALDNLRQAAALGDVEAQQALQLADAIDREQSKADAGVSGWVDITGANMTNIIGAELTALSAPGYALPGYGLPGYGLPGYGFYRPFGPYFGPYLGAEAQMAPIPGALVVVPPAGASPAAAPVVVPVPPGGSVATADPGRTGLLAQIAPVMAPATGVVAVKKELDAKQVLHVEICVDGKCYKTSMDLAPAIELVMKKLVQWHAGEHAPPMPPTTVVQAVEKAIDAAGDSMVGVMVGHHVAVMTSGWLSDIGNAIGSTLRKLQPVISTVATGVATAYGGPAAGAAAAKLAPVVTNIHANILDPKGDPKKKAAAQQALQQVNQEAAVNPTASQALAAANQAVKNTTVAYHVKDRAQRAAEGDPAAQKDINDLVQAAEQGDPAAKSTFEVLAQTFAQEMMKSEAGAKLWEQVTGRGPATISPAAPSTTSGWYDIIGAAIASPTLIAVLDEDGNATARQVMWHPTHDQIQRFGGKIPSLYTEDEGGLFLFADSTGRYSAYRPTWTVMYWSEGGAVPSPVSGWQDVVDAAVDGVRAKAKAHAVTKPGSAAGVLLTVDGRLHGRGFRNLDDAIDWLQHITRNRAAFMYAAAYEKDASGNAYTQDEEFGELPQQTSAPTPIPRELATTGRW